MSLEITQCTCDSVSNDLFFYPLVFDLSTAGEQLFDSVDDHLDSVGCQDYQLRNL